jgi:hypothetical protein
MRSFDRCASPRTQLQFSIHHCLFVWKKEDIIHRLVSYPEDTTLWIQLADELDRWTEPHDLCSTRINAHDSESPSYRKHIQPHGGWNLASIPYRNAIQASIQLLLVGQDVYLSSWTRNRYRLETSCTPTLLRHCIRSGPLESDLTPTAAPTIKMTPEATS